jgi:hypothetical protein
MSLILSPLLASTIPFFSGLFDLLGLLNPANVVPLYLILPDGNLSTPGYLDILVSLFYVTNYFPNIRM